MNIFQKFLALFGILPKDKKYPIESMCMGTVTVGTHLGINHAGDKFMEHKEELVKNFSEHTYKPHNNEFQY